MPSSFINEVILIITAAFIGGFIARSLRLPPVIGYIGSGVLFGTLGKTFVSSSESLLILSQIGVSLLLFTLGFEVSLKSFKHINKKVFIVGILQVLLTALALQPFLLFFNFDFPTSILFSVIFAFSSTAVIVKILEEKGILNNFPGNQVFIFLLIQDLFVVPVIFLLPLLFSGSGIHIISLQGFLLAAIKPLIIFIVLFVMSKFFLKHILNVIFRYPSHELSILATIFIAALSIGLLKWVGIPESVAAFLAGILISEEGKNITPLSEIRPLRDILLVLFFVVIGMLLNVEFVGTHLPEILGLTVSIVGIKFFILLLILLSFSYLPSAALFLSSYLANIGEFAIVIGQLAFLERRINQTSYNLLLSVFILSLLAIPFITKYGRVVQDLFMKIKYVRDMWNQYPTYFRNPSLSNLKNHVILCGHGRVGKEIRSLLELAEVPYVVIDFNKNIISELLSQDKFALYGDPSDEEVLKSAFIKTSKVLIIAVPDSFSQKQITKTALSIHPKVIIICRSHKDEDRIDLINLGVNKIIMPEFEAGLKIGHDVLEQFDISREKLSSFLSRVRSDAKRHYT